MSMTLRNFRVKCRCVAKIEFEFQDENADKALALGMAYARSALEEDFTIDDPDKNLCTVEDVGDANG